MILRGIHVENWCCITTLDLDSLPPGVVVLHGPNRTGKSSLFRALRGCLYDFDHDSRGKELDKAIPWSGDATPKVTVEFVVGGQDYQISKVFSTRKEGRAVLKKKTGNEWRNVEESPKEAARRTRELLGAESSDGGLNQLLWLDQGTVHLPKPKDVNSPLQERLLNILGVLVTGQDQAFKDALDKHCEKWFTAEAKRFRKNSEIDRLELTRQSRQQALDAEEAKFRELERTIAELHNAEDALPECIHAVEQARQEAARLHEQQQRMEERRRLFAEAERECQVAEEALAEAEQRCQLLQDAVARCVEAEQKTARAADDVQRAEREVNQLGEELRVATLQLQDVQLEEAKHLRDQEELSDHKVYLNFLVEKKRVEGDLKRAGELTDEVEMLEQQVAAIRAPTDKQLAEWRANRQNAVELRASLQAAALTLEVCFDQPTRAVVRIDSGETQAVDLPASQEATWQVRQRARVEIPGVGRFGVQRSQADASVEEMARQLVELDRAFDTAMRSYKEDPADPECQTHLAERRHQRENDLRRIKQLRQDLRALAPDGISLLNDQLDENRRQLELLLERRPGLASGALGTEDIARRERAYLSQFNRWKKLRQESADRVNAARLASDKAKDKAGNAREGLAAARAAETSAHKERQRLGEESVLTARRQQADETLAAAKQRLDAAALTEAERSIERECQNADAVVEEREKRLRDLEDELIRLRTRMEGSEGLHSRRTDAAQALQEVMTKLDREMLEAQAHQHLRELFIECRENQVQQVVGPISDRVLEWARHLGLSEYREVRFGDSFLPEGFVSHLARDEQPVSFLEESYGTDEQLSLLVRLALGGVLAKDEPQVAILDDPLAHADTVKHRRILEILKLAADGQVSSDPTAGKLQILILTCHPDRFDHLTGVTHINLAEKICRET